MRYLSLGILGLGLLSSSATALLAAVAWARVGGGAPIPQLALVIAIMGVTSLGFSACNLLCSALFGASARRCQEQLEHLPLRCYLMGWCALLLQVLLVVNAPWAALPLLLLNGLWLTSSLPALAQLAGEGLGLQGRRATVAGSLSLCLTLTLPILGWLLLAQLLLAALGSASLPRAWRAA